MTDLFLSVVNRSITAGILILLIFLLRLLFAQFPKWVNVLLWGLAAVRLICPFSIESTNSLLPNTDWIGEEVIYAEEIHDFTGTADSIAIGEFTQSDEDSAVESSSPGQITEPSGYRRTIVVLGRIWLVEIAVMILYLAGSYFRVFLDSQHHMEQNRT